jgi:hypothetical protein
VEDDGVVVGHRLEAVAGQIERDAAQAELTGLELRFETSERTVGPLPVDTTRMCELLGPTRVPWREGIRRMVEARAPELLR